MKCEKWRGFCCKLVDRLVPAAWKAGRIRALTRLMEQSDPGPEDLVRRKAETFFIRQIITVVLLAAGLLVLLVAMGIKETQTDRTMRLQRNEFGQGDKKVTVILREDKKGGRQEKYVWTLSELQMNSEQKKDYEEDFFRTLKKTVLGKNPSWSRVSRPLYFPESIPAYPFEISFQAQDPDYIYLDGSLSPLLDRLGPGETLSTGILVTASYGDWTLERTWRLKLLSGKDSIKKDPFRKLKKYLSRLEEASPCSMEVSLPGQWGSFIIKEDRQDLNLSLAIAMAGILGFLLPVFRVWQLRQQGDQTRRQAEKDFSSIVHRLTLYLGSGLSFMSAIDRISRDYCQYDRTKGQRYAYEKILIMDRQMKAGVSQTQACRGWGNRLRGTSYQKLALILVQSFSRGSREAGAMMDKEEAEAFRMHVDKARKEGEEASTKLLFPMIIMLGEVTLLVMLPAILRFNSF